MIYKLMAHISIYTTICHLAEIWLGGYSAITVEISNLTYLVSVVCIMIPSYALLIHDRMIGNRVDVPFEAGIITTRIVITVYHHCVILRYPISVILAFSVVCLFMNELSGLSGDTVPHKLLMLLCVCTDLKYIAVSLRAKGPYIAHKLWVCTMSIQWLAAVIIIMCAILASDGLSGWYLYAILVGASHLLPLDQIFKMTDSMTSPLTQFDDTCRYIQCTIGGPTMQPLRIYHSEATPLIEEMVEHHEHKTLHE